MSYNFLFVCFGNVIFSFKNWLSFKDEMGLLCFLMNTDFLNASVLISNMVSLKSYKTNEQKHFGVLDNL